jgi:3-oxoacyl-[acyl-carrier-protein] synthase III
LSTNESLTAHETQLSLSGRSRIGACPDVKIAATGSYAPVRIVTNADLAALGCDSDWIVQRTGIHERRVAADDQASSDLAYLAAMNCLASAGLEPSELDLVVCATMTPDHITPSTACLLQKRLGCVAPAFDVSAACSGFMYALITASQFVRAGSARNALVVGCEVMSRTVNSNDIKTYPLFGDGAGAVLLQPCAPNQEITNGLIRFTLGSEGDTSALCVPAGGSREPTTVDSLSCGRQYLAMDGRTVFKWAVRVVADCSRDLLAAAGLRPEDIDLVILHQANIRIVDAAVSHLGIAREKVFVNLDKFGNTSAASIPMALDDANRLGLIKRGDVILLCGFGAGLSWGAALLRW